MENQIDAVMPKDDYLMRPDGQTIIRLCDKLGLKPVDVLVIARHASTINAAR
jgi:predicted deacetylase